MMTDAKTTKPATDALTDLVNTARKRRDIAAAHEHAKRAAAFDSIAHTLDGARTRLIEDGPEYLDAAWAFIDGARRMLADLDGARRKARS